MNRTERIITCLLPLTAGPVFFYSLYMQVREFCYAAQFTAFNLLVFNQNWLHKDSMFGQKLFSWYLKATSVCKGSLIWTN